MADIKLKYDAATAIAITIDNVVAGAIATSSAIDNSANLYRDILIEVSIADIAEAGNFIANLYLSSSVDGTNYSMANSANLGIAAFLGSVPLIGAGTWRSRAFSAARAFGGTLPPYIKLVVYNDSGVSFAASGNSAQMIGVFETVA